MKWKIKKHKMIAAAVSIFTASSIFISGCSGGDGSESVSTAEKQTSSLENGSSVYSTSLTVDDIMEMYGDELMQVMTIGSCHVLVELQYEDPANMFILFDLENGRRDILPTQAEFVTLEKIINENFFVFISSGISSESEVGSFPYILKCFRVKDDPGETGDFITVSEILYFSLDDAVGSGCREYAQMDGLIITFNGIEVVFGPVEGKGSLFYAAATDIPLTQTSYDSEGHRMTFTIHTAYLAENLAGKGYITVYDNQYISGYEVVKEKDKIRIEADLKDDAKGYYIKKMRLPDGRVFFSVEFGSHVADGSFD